MNTPHDNQVHRALFALPPIKESSETAVAVVTMPKQKCVTGDDEVDAVLWLREVISTGQTDLVAKAQIAAKQIETPLEVVEKRYRDWVKQTQPGNWVEGLKTIGFADLDELAADSIKIAARRQEAAARFGESIFDNTRAEQICEDALGGLVQIAPHYGFDPDDVDKRFDAHAAQRPATLLDCLHELAYWNDLYWLRDAADEGCGDLGVFVNAREDYVFRLLSRIRPRDANESAAVLNYLIDFDGMDREHTVGILFNLIGVHQPYNAKEGAK